MYKKQIVKGLFYLGFFAVIGCDFSGPHMPINDTDAPISDKPTGSVDFSAVKPIFEKACKECHRPGGLPDWTIQKTAEAKAQSIHQRVVEKRNMPPQGKEGLLSEADRKKIGDWALGASGGPAQSGATAAVPTAPAPAAPPGSPESCASCHGEAGISSVDGTPHLAGQKAAYTKGQLLAFRSKTRENPIMNGIAASLTDAQIEALATHFSQLEPPAPLQTVNLSGGLYLSSAEFVKSQKAAPDMTLCLSCHVGPDQKTAIADNPNDNPNLVGQKWDYLWNQLLAFKKGTRTSAIMQNFVTNLSEMDLMTLAIGLSAGPPPAPAAQPATAPQ